MSACLHYHQNSGAEDQDYEFQAKDTFSFPDDGPEKRWKRQAFMTTKVTMRLQFAGIRKRGAGDAGRKEPDLARELKRAEAPQASGLCDPELERPKTSATLSGGR